MTERHLAKIGGRTNTSMKNTLPFIMLGLALAVASAAQDRASERPSAAPLKSASSPSVGDVLTNYITAIGGTVAWEKLKSQIAKGTYENDQMGPGSHALEVYKKAPDKWLFIIRDADGSVFRQGFNGKVGWNESGELESDQVALFGHLFGLRSGIDAVTGGALAVVFGIWGNQMLLAFKPVGVELLVKASLDGRVVAFTLALSVVTGLIFGLAPALQAMRFDPNLALKQEPAVLGGAGGRFPVRDTLVVAEVGLCLLLLMSAGLCLRSFLELHSANHGFNVRNTIVALVSLRGADYTEEKARPVFDRIIEKAKALPGVRSVSFTDSFPLLDGGVGLPVDEIEGYVRRKDEFLVMKFSRVGPDFFETMQIPVLQTSGDNLREQGRLVWVNESFVRRYWPNLDPIGKRIGPYEVTGIVRNSRNKNLWEEPEPYVYVQDMATPPTLSGHLIVRTEGDPRPVLSALRHVIEAASDRSSTNPWAASASLWCYWEASRSRPCCWLRSEFTG